MGTAVEEAKSGLNIQNSGSTIRKIESIKSWFANQRNHCSIVKTLVRIVKVVIPIVKGQLNSQSPNIN